MSRSRLCRPTLRQCVTILLLASWPCGISSAAPDVIAHVTRADGGRFPLVRCFVTVTDEKGQSLAGLTAESFAVSEDGRPVHDLKVSSVLPGDQTIAVVLVLDRSGSMRGAPISAAVEAARDFAGRLSEGDALGLITFSSRVDPPAPLSTDRKATAKRLDAIRSRGETALYDAVRQAIGLLSRSTGDRKAVVALTDGQDNASAATAQQCADAARADSISIYCVGLGRSVNEKALRLMGEASGGLVFMAGSPDNLIGIYRQVAHEIKSQYVLTYSSPVPNADNTWRTVSVSVREKGIESSDRRQYLAASETGSAKPPSGWLSVGAVAIVVAAAAVVDLVLVIAVLTRRSSRRRNRGSAR